MAEDYDTRRRAKGTVEIEVDSLEGLQIQRAGHQTATIDASDYSEEGFDLPDADDGLTFAEDEMTVPVVPMQQTKEFRCSSCFLVHPIRRRAYNRAGQPVCSDCA